MHMRGHKLLSRDVNLSEETSVTSTRAELYKARDNLQGKFNGHVNRSGDLRRGDFQSSVSHFERATEIRAR